uniref:Uncharacterized protein n=1 Tax=Solanum lycopersicum TaxID=4081 RepID=A0A3Q7G114_SOLLC
MDNLHFMMVIFVYADEILINMKLNFLFYFLGSLKMLRRSHLFHIIIETTRSLEERVMDC